MAEKTEKVYIGSGKVATTKFGDILKLSFWPKDFETMEKNKNDGGWINIDIQKRKEADKYGNTHYGLLNTWKPEPRAQTQAQEADSMDKLGSGFSSPVNVTSSDAPF